MRAFDMIDEARDLLNDPAGDFWTDAKLLTHLNRSLRDVSSRSRTIREAIYRRANAGQSVYALPEGFLGNDKFAWLYAGNWYPLSKRTLTQVEFLNNSDVFSAWRPFFYDVWGRTREEKIVAAVEATSHNFQFLDDFDFPTYDQTFFFLFPKGLQGIDDIKVGDLIINMTDGAEGHVTERHVFQPGEVVFAAARLTNGKRAGDDFGRIMPGDLLRVLSPNVSGHALRVAPPPIADSSGGEEVLWMYLSRRHYTIEQSHIDNVNDNLELDIELETPGLERLMYWCRREELGARDPESIAQGVLYEEAYRRAAPQIHQRNREHLVTWGTPSVSAFRLSLQLEGVSTTSGHALNNVFIG